MLFHKFPTTIDTQNLYITSFYIKKQPEMNILNFIKSRNTSKFVSLSETVSVRCFSKEIRVKFLKAKKNGISKIFREGNVASSSRSCRRNVSVRAN